MGKSNNPLNLEMPLSTNRSKRELLRLKRKEQKRRNLITALIIVLAAGALFTVAIFLPKIIMDRAKYASVEGFTIGNPDAPVSVVQFSSYSCGFCAEFNQNQEPSFIADYVDTGQVFYRYVNIPGNNATSQLAAEASYCAADQDGFFEYKDYLYANSTTGEGFSAANLVNYAASAGLNTEEFQNCLDGDRFARAFMDDVTYAQNVGLTGTPSFLVNDQLLGASELVPAVDALLGNE